MRAGDRERGGAGDLQLPVRPSMADGRIPAAPAPANTPAAEGRPSTILAGTTERAALVSLLPEVRARCPRTSQCPPPELTTCGLWADLHAATDDRASAASVSDGPLLGFRSSSRGVLKIYR